jgi:hypothetical protein
MFWSSELSLLGFQNDRSRWKLTADLNSFLKLDFKDSYLTIEPAFDLDFDLLEFELFRANIYKFESFVDYLLYFYVFFSFRRAELG